MTTASPATPRRSPNGWRGALRQLSASTKATKLHEMMQSSGREHPGFVEAVLADARATAAYRGERRTFDSKADAALQIVRLACVSDAFLAQVLYRAKASLQARRIPVLPRLCHRLAIATAQVCIGDPVVIGPGLYLPHGQVVIDGITNLGEGCIVRPWVTIGLREGLYTGPTLGRGVSVGTGAKLIGPVTIGDGAKIGANAVVTRDVPARATAVGVPARVVDR